MDPTSFPQRVPMKVIGRSGELHPEMLLSLILEHLGPQADGDQAHQAHCKGAFISHTFWITLRTATEERPLREAIARLPGYLMQL
jgi:putative lipoic acid-binding regulatory protein